jgi:hypothetical protein
MAAKGIMKRKEMTKSSVFGMEGKTILMISFLEEGINSGVNHLTITSES